MRARASLLMVVRHFGRRLAVLITPVILLRRRICSFRAIAVRTVSPVARMCAWICITHRVRRLVVRVLWRWVEVAILLLPRRDFRLAVTLLLVSMVLPISRWRCTSLLNRVLFCSSTTSAVLQLHLRKVRVILVLRLLRLVARHAIQQRALAGIRIHLLLEQRIAAPYASFVVQRKHRVIMRRAEMRSRRVRVCPCQGVG